MIEKQTPGLGPINGEGNQWKRLFLRGVVDRYEGDHAVLVFDDGQRLLWPREQLPTGAREGVAVAIALTVDLMDTERRSTRLKDLRGVWGGGSPPTGGSGVSPVSPFPN